MLQTNSLIGFGANVRAPTITHTDYTFDEVNRSVYTFSSQAVGTAGSNRDVAVCVTLRGNSTSPTSVTVGGTNLSQAVSSIASSDVAEIWIGAIPTGTTADVVVTFSASQSRCAVNTYAIYDLVSTTPSDTATSSADPASLNMDIPSGNSIALGCAYTNTTSDATWTGLTEDNDSSDHGGNFAASDAFSSSETDRTIECDYSSATSPSACAAVFK